MSRTEHSASLPVIFLMGPTASGKTALAVELVRALPLDIISVDSAMVYRGMDIGTAKPGADILAVAPHRLIDICEPEQAYSAGQFCVDARREIAAIHAEGRIPLLVGGTGLYFRSLQYGFSEMPAADLEVRGRIEAEAEQFGWGVLHQRLAEVDPVAAARIHQNDPQRIQRALEIHALTGKPISALHEQGRSQALDNPVIKLIVAPAQRAELGVPIRARFMSMLEQGLVDEVERLRACPGLTAGSTAMRLVGYRQVWSYLDGEYDYNTMIDKGIHATSQLAKRQMTWLRREQEAHWFDASRPKLSHYLLNFLGQNPVYSYRL
jgi:tRNA dimethylallyltransferase